MKTRNALLPALAVLSMLAAPLQAQVAGAPAFVDYQGTAYKSTGEPLGSTGSSPGPYTATPTNYTMLFKIFGSQSGTDLIYAETQTVTASLGQFSVRLGSGAPIAGLAPAPTQSSISNAFNGTDRYLEVTVIIPPAVTGTPITPRLAFQSSPFSFVAQRARLADEVNGKVTATAGSTFTGTVNATGGTLSGAITAAGTTFTGGSFSSGSFSGSFNGPLAGNATTATTAGNVSGIVAIANGGTGSNSKSFVDLSTTQTVGGNKSFNGAVAIGTSAAPAYALDVTGEARVSGKYLSRRDRVINAGHFSPGTTWDIREVDCTDFASQARGFYIRLYVQRNTAPYEVWNYEGHVTFAQSGFVNNPTANQYRNAIIRWTTKGDIQFRFGAVVTNGTVPSGEFTTLLNEGTCNVYDFKPGSLNPPSFNTIYGADTTPYLYFAFPPGMAGQIMISDN